VSRRRRQARGFTLIEVLVALIIVTFGMGALMSALTTAAQTTMQLREKSFAEWIGLNQLATARLSGALPATGKSENEVEFAGSKWHWQQDVSDMEVPGLKRIVIQVRHAGDGVAKDRWLATVVGFRGDAISTPRGVISYWDNATIPGGGGGGGAGGSPQFNPTGKPK
jgi:general secretion pathway protein I